MKMLDLAGKQFGRWTVVSRAPNTSQGQARWLCCCECGTEKIVKSIVIRRGLSQSCGCLKLEILRERSTKHGHANSGQITPTYNSWAGMMARCSDDKNKHYARYGGRGIKVCKRWLKFSNFLEDMGQKPKGTSLDRIDNSAGYSPNNCRWATPSQQARNKRNTKLMTLHGETRPLCEWSELLKINPRTLWHRTTSGWSDEDALTKPVRRG